MKMKKMCLLVLLMFVLGIFMIACDDESTNNEDPTNSENQTDGNDSVVDVTNPTVSLDVASIAYVDSEIQISYQVSDDVSQNEKITTTVSVMKESTNVEVSNDSFIPRQAGNYEVTVKATDEAGNSSVASKVINVFNVDDALINITTNDATADDVVEVTYKVSTLVTNIDDLEKSIIVTYEGEELTLDKNKFVAAVGEYEIKVVLTDSKGNYIEGIKTITVIPPYRQDRNLSQYQAPTNELDEDKLPLVDTNASQEVIKLSNNDLAMVYGAYRLDFVKNSSNQYVLQLVNIASGDKNAVYASNASQVMFVNNTPATVYLRGSGNSIATGYDSVVKTDYGICATKTFNGAAGSQVLIKDCYYFAAEKEVGAFNVRKSVQMVSVSNKDTGFASEYGFVSNGCNSAEWMVPNVVYKSYSGSSSTYQETYLGVPMIMLRNTANGYTLSLSRYQPIVTYLNNSYASLKLDNTNKGISVSYPANTGNRLYHDAKTGAMHVYDLTIRAEITDSYEEALPSVYNAHFNLQNQRIVNTDIDEVYSAICEDYKVFLHEEKQEDELSGKKYTSYGLPWRIYVETGEFGPYTYQSGFIGQQIPSAYNMMFYGLMNNDLESLQNGINVIDFWVEDAEMMSIAGVPHIWYDTWSDGFRSYPCFLRMAVDTMEGLLDAYLLAETHGLDKSSWYDALEQFGEFLVNNQNPDGSYYRCYNYGGEPYKNWDDGIEEPPGNICQSESKANTPMAIRFLGKMYELTGEECYYDAALKAGEYTYNYLYEIGSYRGGTCDNPNATDKEAGVYAMYAYDTLYMLTGDEKWLDCLKQATAFTMTTVIIYSFGVRQSSLKSGLPVYAGYTDGMSFISCFYGSGVDNYIAYIYHELFRIYVLTGEETYLKQAEFIQQNTKSIMNWDGALNYDYKSLVAEASGISSLSYGSADNGVWVTWSSVANAEPIAKMYNNFGNADVATFKNVDIEILRAQLENVGCGGKTHTFYENTVIEQVE